MENYRNFIKSKKEIDSQKVVELIESFDGYNIMEMKKAVSDFCKMNPNNSFIYKMKNLANIMVDRQKFIQSIKSIIE